MFLKSEPLKHNGASVTLYELSALQRIEHLEYLKKIEAVEEGDIQTAMETTVRGSAFVVAMSLWHAHALKGTLPGGAAEEVKKIQDEVLSTWSLEVLALAEYRIKILSGMLPPPEDVTEPESDVQAEPVTAEKSSPAS
ncbi:TPA: phage minor tail protein G [Citrobacter farmeri]|nr:phage minor tail protein G [Citrobacter farmeri]